jgi:hypothetical protein
VQQDRARESGDDLRVQQQSSSIDSIGEDAAEQCQNKPALSP